MLGIGAFFQKGFDFFQTDFRFSAANLINPFKLFGIALCSSDAKRIRGTNDEAFTESFPSVNFFHLVVIATVPLC